jgi:bifunctional DNA-binding transcriptional regulator/antitoxin component of YhaV-PrlF toxin-antitoxin module
MTYTLKVERNKLTDEYYVILPKELLDQVGWAEGDKIRWKEHKGGSFILTKIKENK